MKKLLGSIVLVAWVLTLVGSAQPASSPTAPKRPRAERPGPAVTGPALKPPRPAVVEAWREVQTSPDNLPRLRSRLAGLKVTQGEGRRIAIYPADIPAAKASLAALQALRSSSSGKWAGSVEGWSDDDKPDVVFMVRTTEEFRRDQLTVSYPTQSSIEVIELQAASATRELFEVFTELTLASQLWPVSDSLRFRLERLLPNKVLYSLKAYDQKSRNEFLKELRDWVDTTPFAGQKLELKAATTPAQPILTESAAVRLRSQALARWPQQWVNRVPIDLQASAPVKVEDGTELVQIWMSRQIDGPEMSDKLLDCLYVLLDAKPESP